MAALLAVSVAVSAPPLAAQDGPTQDGPAPEAGGDGLGEGLDLLGRGAESFLRGLMDEIGPELRRLEPELRGLAEGIGPMIAELVELIDQIDAYHPPERLPNGDIILRRKTPLERVPEPEGEDGEQIEI